MKQISPDNYCDTGGGTDLQVLTDRYNELQDELEKQSLICTQLNSEAHQIEVNVNKLTESINSLWNPKNWFDSQQRHLRSRVSALEKLFKEANENSSKARVKQQNIKEWMNAKIAEIEKYKNFNFDNTSENRIMLAIQLTMHMSEVEKIANKKKQVDDCVFW